LKYFEARGEMDEIWDVAEEAINTCRRTRTPVFLHLQVTRLWGHAGTDVETTYRTVDEIAAEEMKDPLLLNARRLIEMGAATPEELRPIVAEVKSEIDSLLGEAAKRPKPTTVAEVIEPLSPYNEAACRALADMIATDEARKNLFDNALPEFATAPTKRTM